MQTTPIQLPTQATAAEAREARRRLATTLQQPATEPIRLRPEGGGPGEVVTVPRAAFEVFLAVLEQMSHGNAVALTPIHAELTTQQAADLLNVSRPHLVELLEAGTIPHRKVGRHRRVRAADLLAYKTADDARRAAVADDLATEAQTLGLDD